MKKKLLLLIPLALALAVHPAEARNADGERFFDKLHFNLEWGITQTLFNAYHYNILSEEGYRIDSSGSGFMYDPSGFVAFGVGVDFFDRLLLSLYGAYVGITDDTQIVPLTLRLNYFPKTIHNDGFLIFIDGGVGMNLHSEIRNNSAALAGLGGGYRLILSRRFSLDFLLGIRAAFVKPNIPSPDGPGYVTEDNIRRNNASYYALSFTIALSL